MVQVFCQRYLLWGFMSHVRAILRKNVPGGFKSSSVFHFELSICNYFNKLPKKKKKVEVMLIFGYCLVHAHQHMTFPITTFAENSYCQ